MSPGKPAGPSSSPRLVALRELAAEAELERRDFLYEATEQLRRFVDQNRDRLREIGPIKLVDNEQDYLLYHRSTRVETRRHTGSRDSEWYDQEQSRSISELISVKPRGRLRVAHGGGRDAPSLVAAASSTARRSWRRPRDGEWEAGCRHQQETWRPAAMAAEMPPPQLATAQGSAAQLTATPGGAASHGDSRCSTNRRHAHRAATAASRRR